MEEAFGANFGNVRIHTSADADESARDISAKAFTVGSDVAFRSGEYEPQSERGRTLLAHELAHVLQQRSASRLVDSSHAHSGLERNAREASRSVIAGVPRISVSHAAIVPAVQRQADDDDDRPKIRGKVDAPEDDLTERSHESEAKRHRSQFGETIEQSPTEKHHAFPKFLGGKKSQDLVKMPYEMHYLYHRELDRLLEREFKQLGKLPKGQVSFKKYGQIFDTLTPEEQERVLTKVVEHADEFDNRKDTKGIPYKKRYKSKSTLGGEIRKEIKRVRPKFVAPKVKRARAKGRTSTKVGSAKRKTGKLAGSGKHKPTRRKPKRKLKGSFKSLGLMFGLGLTEEAFVEIMLDDLEKLPQPKIDWRGAEEYLTDPQREESMKLIELFNKELGPFEKELKEHHSWTWTAAGEAMRASEVDDLEERIAWLGEIQDELSTYGSELDVISDNLDAVLELESDALESAAAADALVEMMYWPFIGENIVESVGVEGFSRAESALRYHSAAIKKLFRDAHKLRKSLDKMMEERDGLEETVSDIKGLAYREVVAERMEQQRAEREAAEKGESEPPAEEAEDEEEAAMHEGAEETPKEQPKTQPKPLAEPKQKQVVKPDLWKRCTTALRRARLYRNDPKSRDVSASELAEQLRALVREIASREFAHDEERDVFLGLSGELLDEIRLLGHL